MRSPIRRSFLAAPAVVGRPTSVGLIAWQTEGLLGLPESVDTSAYLAFWRRLPRKLRRLVSGKRGFEWWRPKRGHRRVLRDRFRRDNRSPRGRVMNDEDKKYGSFPEAYPHVGCWLKGRKLYGSSRGAPRRGEKRRVVHHKGMETSRQAEGCGNKTPDRRVCMSRHTERAARWTFSGVLPTHSRHLGR